MEIVKKIWGEEHIFRNTQYCFKKLIINYGFICSYHQHKKKDECFFIGETSGPLYMGLSGKKFKMFPGDFVHVPTGYPHNFAAIIESGAHFYEISSYDDPEDSYRRNTSSKIDKSILGGMSLLPTFKEMVDKGYFNEFGDPLFPGGK
jgi:mannose-6-phosphate isomerase-like protein (cupin superfamily)